MPPLNLTLFLLPDVVHAVLSSRISVLKRGAVLALLSALLLHGPSVAASILTDVASADSERADSTHADSAEPSTQSPDASASGSGSVMSLRVGRVQFGDSLAWANPSFDDSAWEKRFLYRAPDSTGVYWIRTSVTLDDSASRRRPGAVLLSALASSELYWDGIRIGRNGTVGDTQATETPGRLRTVAAVPDSLYTPGAHTLALRLSNAHAPRDLTYTLYTLAVGPYARFVRGAEPSMPLLFIGGFLVIMVYTGVLFFLNPRRRDVGILAAFCLVLALLTGLESLRDLINYPYVWHGPRLRAITALTSVLGLLLPAFVLVQFDVPRRRLALVGVAAALGAVLALPLTSDATVFGLYGVMIASAVAAAGWALWKRRNGAGIGFAGLIACAAALLLTEELFPDRYFAPTFALLGTGLMGTLALRAHRETTRRRGAELRQTRLELELVKRHLQPHFLKNTLTAAMEWIEADPARGVAFLGSVADLLSSINEASNQTLITMEQEIAMCQAYLHVMSGRTGQTYQLETENLAIEAHVPPALFLTLVENGVTHARREAGTSVRFVIRETKESGRRRYELTVSPVRAPSLSGGDLGADSSGGTGLRYVRSRLAEVTSDHALRSEFAPPDAWQTEIEVPLHLSPADPAP